MILGYLLAPVEEKKELSTSNRDAKYPHTRCRGGALSNNEFTKGDPLIKGWMFRACGFLRSIGKKKKKKGDDTQQGFCMQPVANP